MSIIKKTEKTDTLTKLVSDTFEKKDNISTILSSLKKPQQKIAMVPVKCPGCGANLEIEDGIASYSCPHCGTKVQMNNLSDSIVRANLRLKQMKHTETMVDKTFGFISNSKAEKARQRSEEKKRASIGMTIMAVVSILGLCTIGVVEHKESKNQELILQQTVYEIQKDIDSGDYDSALIKANGLYYTSNYSDELKEKWDNQRESIIELITTKKAEFNDKTDDVKAYGEEDIKQNVSAQIPETPSTQDENIGSQIKNEEIKQNNESEVLIEAKGEIEENAVEIVEPVKKELAVGDVVSFGQYVNSNSYDDKPKALNWTVLCIEDGKALLLTRSCVEKMAFNDTLVVTSSSWKNSSLRNWLNNDFYQLAFNNEEQNYIIKTKVYDTYKDGTEYAESTKDNVFLLSCSDIDLYFNGNIKPGSLKVEWWLISVVSDGTGFYRYTVSDDKIDWLRVNESGGVRPAIWVDISSDYFKAM